MFSIKSAKQLALNLQNKIFKNNRHMVIEQIDPQHQSKYERSSSELPTPKQIQSQKFFSSKQKILKLDESIAVQSYSNSGDDMYDQQKITEKQDTYVEPCDHRQENHYFLQQSNQRQVTLNQSIAHQHKIQATTLQNIASYFENKQQYFTKIKQVFTKYVVNNISLTTEKIKQYLPHKYTQIQQHSFQINENCHLDSSIDSQKNDGKPLLYKEGDTQQDLDQNDTIYAYKQ